MNGTLLLAGKLAGTAALATGALITGVDAAHSSGTPSADTTQQCQHRHQADPQLKAARKDARSKPAGKERRTALRQVQKDARQGKYGDKAQVASFRREIAQLRLRAQAPDALKADLKTARQEPAGQERRQAVQKVWQAAASGTYGDQVEKVAKKAEQRREKRQSCRATRSRQTS